MTRTRSRLVFDLVFLGIILVSALWILGPVFAAGMAAVRSCTCVVYDLGACIEELAISAGLVEAGSWMGRAVCPSTSSGSVRHNNTRPCGRS